jgi:hypothetical protein
MLYHLKKELEKKAGFRLSSVKAYRRFEKILYEGGYFVSYSTLNRIFSISKKSVNPRSETLNILSQYLGYHDFEHFMSSAPKSEQFREKYYSTEIEFKAYLLNQDYQSAIDLYHDIKNEEADSLEGLTQILGKQLFNNKEFEVGVLELLLKREKRCPYFVEYFVYEDDPYGHYQWTLENIYQQASNQDEKAVFNCLFINRKNILKGNSFDFEELNPQKFSFHLSARYYEMELLVQKATNKKISPNFVIDKTNQVIQHLSKLKTESEKLALIGRWNRGLIYSNAYPLLKNHQEWYQLSLAAFQIAIDNLEFKAAIYAFLKLAHGLSLPLDFYKFNRYENAVSESQLILSMAFGNEKAVNAYRKYLGISLELGT